MSNLGGIHFIGGMGYHPDNLNIYPGTYDNRNAHVNAMRPVFTEMIVHQGRHLSHPGAGTTARGSTKSKAMQGPMGFSEITEYIQDRKRAIDKEFRKQLIDMPPDDLERLRKRNPQKSKETFKIYARRLAGKAKERIAYNEHFDRKYADDMRRIMSGDVVGLR